MWSQVGEAELDRNQVFEAEWVKGVIQALDSAVPCLPRKRGMVVDFSGPPSQTLSYPIPSCNRVLQSSLFRKWACHMVKPMQSKLLGGP